MAVNPCTAAGSKLSPQSAASRHSGGGLRTNNLWFLCRPKKGHPTPNHPYIRTGFAILLTAPSRIRNQNCCCCTFGSPQKVAIQPPQVHLCSVLRQHILFQICYLKRTDDALGKYSQGATTAGPGHSPAACWGKTFHNQSANRRVPTSADSHQTRCASSESGSAR